MMRNVKDFKVAGRRVLVRCDFNVSLDSQDFIVDDFRIRETLPTVLYLISQRAKVILISHLGDPKGSIVPSLALDKVQERLTEYLHCLVKKATDCIGKEVEDMARIMAEGEVLLLENVRFHKEEEENKKEFAKKLSLLGDVFINDAFSVSHRNHASVAGIPQFLPSASGLLLQKEMLALGKFLKNPEHPFLVIVGGKKEDKLSFIDQISNFADAVLLGNLLFEEAKKQHVEFKNKEKIIVPVDGGLDIGPETVRLFIEKINNAKSIFWTGPLGNTEQSEYAKGSLLVANAIGERKAYSIAGGGDLVSFLNVNHLMEKFSYVSTGGGATLEFLAGEELPGLKALGYYE